MIFFRLGKEFIMWKVFMFDFKYCFLDVVLEVKRIIFFFMLEEIWDVSNGVVVFYNWVIQFVNFKDFLQMY